jgi:hypothetical protein
MKKKLEISINMFKSNLSQPFTLSFDGHQNVCLLFDQWSSHIKVLPLPCFEIWNIFLLVVVDNDALQGKLQKGWLKIWLPCDGTLQTKPSSRCLQDLKRGHPESRGRGSLDRVLIFVCPGCDE